MAVEPGVTRDRAGSGRARRTADGSSSAAPSNGLSLETLVARSIHDVDRREWDSLFPGELEGWSYLRAVERAELENCDPMYFAIRGRDGLVAAAPGFVGRQSLGEPWRGTSRTQWRRARDRALVLGSPLTGACRVGFAPQASETEQARSLESLFRAVREEAARLGVDAVLTRAERAGLGDSTRRFGPVSWHAGTRRESTVQLPLPPWSFSDYLSCLDEPLRGRLLRVCALAAPYRREWRVDLDADVEPMLALCRDAGLEELNAAYFENLLGPEVCASCLIIRFDGRLAGFSLMLHGAHALREKLTIVSRRVKGSLVRALIWLETIRFCLECSVATYESTSELSQLAAGSAR